MEIPDKENFFHEYDKVLKRLSAQVTEVLREDPIWENPTLHEQTQEIVIRLKERLHLKEIQDLLLIVEYIEEPRFQGILRMIISDQSRHLDQVQQSVTIDLLGGKVENYLLVIETSLFGKTPRAFFSRILQWEKKNLTFLHMKIFLRRKSIPRFPQRKRGYHDHGTLRPLDKWTETSDWSLTQKQNEIERYRDSLKETAQFIKDTVV